MPYILWIEESGKPRILGIMDEVYASTGETNRHTYTQFEKLHGRAIAEAALGRFYREMESSSSSSKGRSN